MEQLPKILYLTKDDKGLKLRRRVPEDLRRVVGKSEWVERCAGISWPEVKARSAKFAVWTNDEIAAARATQAGPAASAPAAAIAPGFIIRPTIRKVEEIARTYFDEREERQRELGVYTVNPEADEEAMEEAGLALREARLTKLGKSLDPREDRSTFYHRDAVQLFVRYGHLSPEAGRDHTALSDPLVLKDAAFLKLVDLIARAEVELASRAYKARANDEEPPDAFFSGGASASIGPTATHTLAGGTVAELVGSFLEDKKRQVGSSRMSQFNVPTRALKEELGATFRVEEITRAHCQEIANLLVQVPSHATQHYKGSSLREASEAHKAKHGDYPSRYDEAGKGLAVLKMALDWAVEHGWISTNPADRVKIIQPARAPKKSERAERGYHPFTPEELRKILAAPLFTGSMDDEHRFSTPGPVVHRRSRYWAPLIALWTGMRLNEILQLERGDIRQSDGIFYFDVNDKEEIEYDPEVFQKRLKTEHSVRNVPMRDELIRLGFVDWALQRPPGRLFPDASGSTSERPSLVFSKRFNTFLRSRGVWASRTKVFHSFRNNFTDALRDGGVSEEYREAILGWSDQGKMDRRYGHGHKLKQLKVVVDKATYSGLNLNHLYR